MLTALVFGLAAAAARLEDNPDWIAREKVIQEHNKHADKHGWTMRHNDRFLGQPLGSSKPMLGALLRDGTEEIPKGVRTKAVYNGTTALPDNFDSVSNWPECADVIGDIRDQSNCGCCWAFGGAEAASDRLCIYSKGQIKIPLSANELCFCAESDGCEGGQLYTSWSYLGDTGLVSGGNYNDTGALGGGFCSKYPLPHCHHHGPQGDDPYPAEGQPGCPSESSPSCPTSCDSDAKSPHSDFSDDHYGYTGEIDWGYNSNTDLQRAIQQYGPVETAFTVYSDFENYAGGIYQKTSSTVLGGHAVRIVGWGVEDGTDYWKVANSWNPYWGEKGYFRIVRGVDSCGIESQAMASSGDVVWKQK